MQSKEKGQGQSASHGGSVTTSGRAPYTPSPATDGETTGVGSSYAATLNERENKSNMRNTGPSRDGGPVGDKMLPVANMGSRNTGRVGG